MNVYELKSLKDTVGRDPYVGRGIILGMTPGGRPVAAYFITGRSENSRNRVFELRVDGLYTKAFDESKVADPSLIIYRAAARYGNSFVVTNGDQTDTVIDALKTGGTFESALGGREFEPDAPNFTPRISAMVADIGDKVSYRMSILKSVDGSGSGCARFYFNYPARPGVGHFIHTYMGDGSPLPSFQGEPERIAIPEDVGAFANDVWNTLDGGNRISLFVFVPGEGEKYIFNKNGDMQ